MLIDRLNNYMIFLKYIFILYKADQNADTLSIEILFFLNIQYFKIEVLA